MVEQGAVTDPATKFEARLLETNGRRRLRIGPEGYGAVEESDPP